LNSYDTSPSTVPRIRGFTAQRESDLRLGIRLVRFLLGPADILDPAKSMVFGESDRQGRQPYAADMRGVLKTFAAGLYKKHNYTLNAANEIEGFLFNPDARAHYHETGKFRNVNTGGLLPLTARRSAAQLHRYVTAEVQRSMGFQNEKDHPEVALLAVRNQLQLRRGGGCRPTTYQLYKTDLRQVARNMGLTACFLPKPVFGVNGSGMHTNVPSSKGGKNRFWDRRA